MIQFIHTADTHFGVENYGKIDSKTGIHSRLLDFEKALNACIDTAIERDVDFFLFAGDAYKTATPSPTQQRLLLKCFLRLYKANIPVVIVVGNHDNPLSFGKAHALNIFDELPIEGFHVIAKPAIITLETKKGAVQIVGIPWPTRNTLMVGSQHLHKSASHITEYISKAVGTIIQELAKKLDTVIPSVLAGHLTVSNGVFSGSEKRAIYGSDPLLLPSQLAIEPFDYVGLGHLHRYQNLNSSGYPAIIYSGSLERIDFGERNEEKGFCLVDLKKNETTHKFIKVPTRPFVHVEVKLAADKNQTEQILQALEKHSIKDAIVKIVYHIPAEKKDLVDLQAIQRACLPALHLVGILPVKPPVTRERRAHAKVEMDFTTLLDTYFATKPELSEKKDDLIKKALMLMDDYASAQEQNATEKEL